MRHDTVEVERRLTSKWEEAREEGRQGRRNLGGAHEAHQHMFGLVAGRQMCNRLK